MIFVLLALSVAACPRVREAHADCREDEPRCRPELAGWTLGGERLEESALEGKVVLVNFWATWCKPCVKEIPALQAAHDAHARQGFVVVGIVAADAADDAQVQQFISDHAMSYPVLRDPDGALGRKFELTPALPTTYVYDRAGKLVARRTGGLDHTEVEKLIAPLLAEAR